MTVSALSDLDRTTLRERALDSIRTAIISGELKPGEHLGEVHLAGRLGVSRGTVREALRYLQQQGLVVVGQRGMLRVQSLSPKEVAELFRVRAALETLAIQDIVNTGETNQAATILSQTLPPASTAGLSLAECIDRDLAFHRRLCELSGNSILVEAWLHLENRMRVVILAGADNGMPDVMTAAHHAPLVDVVRRADASQAAAVVAEHMSLASQRMSKP